MNDDKNITASEVQTLASRDGVVASFAGLGYRTDSRQPQSTAAMGITAASLVRQIRHIERVAVHDDGAEPLDVYLIELTSVTVAATHGLARALRNRAGNYLLILTDDYERIDFVLLQRYLRAASSSPMTTQQVSVRPRILTVNPSESFPGYSYASSGGSPIPRRTPTRSTTSSYPPIPSQTGRSRFSTIGRSFPTTT